MQQARLAMCLLGESAGCSGISHDRKAPVWVCRPETQEARVLIGLAPSAVRRVSGCNMSVRVRALEQITEQEVNGSVEREKIQPYSRKCRSRSNLQYSSIPVDMYHR